MFNIEERYGVSWFNRRYCGLLVDFPAIISPEILKKDPLCEQHDPEEAYLSLKSAHSFLTGIAHEFLSITEETDDKQTAYYNVFSKLDLLWSLCFFGQVKEDSNEYCYYFSKSAFPKIKWEVLPDSYVKAFRNISDNCYVEYFKNDKPVDNYKVCDRGIVRFDDRLTALGLHLFYKKNIQKRWYLEEDIGATRYSENTGYNPETGSITANRDIFNRGDMRIFNCGDRLRYNVIELLAGYGDELKKCFKKIYNFVEENYPDCMPFTRIGVVCSFTFGVDSKHRMIGQVNVGKNENHFDAYIAMTGKEMNTLMVDIDSFSEKIVSIFLHDPSCDCYGCKQKHGKNVYRSKTYNRAWKNTENRFLIENENDTNQAIKCIKIKAECNMNTRSK